MSDKNGNGNDQGAPAATHSPPARLSFEFVHRGYQATLTLSDFSGIDLLKKFDAAIGYLEKIGAMAPGAAVTSLQFEAESMAASLHEGKVYWKVKGSQFRKFGVTIWPEVLEEAGWVAEEMQPTTTYDLTGWVAHCELNEEGQPRKVVKLVKVQ